MRPQGCIGHPGYGGVFGKRTERVFEVWLTHFQNDPNALKTTTMTVAIPRTGENGNA